MIKTVFVGARMAGSDNGLQHQVIDCTVDGERLSEDIESASGQLTNEGFSIVSVTPITSSLLQPLYQGATARTASSYTCGVVILGQKP